MTTTIQLLRSELAASLEMASTALPPKTSFAVLKMLRLDPIAAGLRVTAFDYEMMVRVVAKGAASGEQSLLLAGADLNATTATLADGNVILRAQGTNGIVESGRAKIKLRQAHALTEWPATPTVDYVGEPIAWPALRAAFARTEWAVSQAKSRPTLNGVHLLSNGETIRLIGADGYCMACETIAAPGAPVCDVILPTRALAAFARVFGSSGTVRIGFTTEQNFLGVRAEETGAEVVTKLINGPYPDVYRVVPTTFSRVAVIDRDLLAAALRRVGVVRDLGIPTVGLTWGGDTVHLSAESSDRGTASDIVMVDAYEGETLTLGFNVDHLLDLLKRVPTPRVRLSLTNERGAMLAHPVEGTVDWFGVAMPARVLAGGA